MPRILFYAVNGLGLGHVTRLLGIARALRRVERDAEVLFLTSSEADTVVYREGFAAVKLPSKTIREECGLRRSTYLKTVQALAWTAISSFDPDVLVVDTFPGGGSDELLPVLRWRQRNVFVFREQRVEEGASDLTQSMLRLYDLVLIPHADASLAGPVPEPAKALAVGPVLIRERSELPSRDAARRTLGLPTEGTLMWASFGGGGDPEANRALALTAEVLSEFPGVKLVAGAGPLSRASPAVPGATMIQGKYPAIDFLPAFDVAVAAAGYNAVNELLFTGVPSVFVPFDRRVDDQARRASRVSAMGAGVACVPLTRDGLGRAVREVLDPKRQRDLRDAAHKAVPKNGAERAARAILELM
jgi:UDP-N-acetylglucosamine--N-acetylmuramyl-(pentapeptide) pyrophosphoryl-undecaprenol N-acetylglucosamine transferase